MSEINKGPLCYGNVVTGLHGLNSFEHWLCTTAWPEQHDQGIMYMRDFAHALGRRGFNWDAMLPTVSEGRFRFVDGEQVVTEDQCYRVQFKHPTVTPDEPMCELYFIIDEKHPDRRTTGMIPIFTGMPEAFQVYEVETA